MLCELLPSQDLDKSWIRAVGLEGRFGSPDMNAKVPAGNQFAQVPKAPIEIVDYSVRHREFSRQASSPA